MHRIAIPVLAAAALLSGCSAASQAASKYEKAKAAGANNKDLCDRAKVTAQAYLDAGDGAKYKEWDDKAKLDCALWDIYSVPRH